MKFDDIMLELQHFVLLIVYGNLFIFVNLNSQGLALFGFFCVV